MTAGPQSALPDLAVIADNWRRIGTRQDPAQTVPASTTVLVDPIGEARRRLLQTRALLLARFPDAKRQSVVCNFLEQVENAVCNELQVTRESLLGEHCRASVAGLEPTPLHDAITTLEEVCEAFMIAEGLRDDA